MSLLSHALETSRRSYSGRATRFLLVRARRFLLQRARVRTFGSVGVRVKRARVCATASSDRECRPRIIGCECDEFLEDYPPPPFSLSSSSSSSSSSRIESLRPSVTRTLCHRWDYPCSLFPGWGRVTRLGRLVARIIHEEVKDPGGRWELIDRLFFFIFRFDRESYISRILYFTNYFYFENFFFPGQGCWRDEDISIKGEGKKRKKQKQKKEKEGKFYGVPDRPSGIFEQCLK